MRNKKLVWIITMTLVLTIIGTMTACAKAAEPMLEETAAVTEAAASTEAVVETAAAEPVTLTFFSFNPDRSAGEGLAEQMVIDNYVALNPNVKIEVEALASDAGTQKINAYMAGNNLPDIIRIFGNSAVMGPYVSGGYLAELNPDDYASDNFLPGSFSAFTYDGKLYGLPKNSDTMVLFYNKALFDKYGVQVPETFDELLAAGEVFNANGIAPIAIDGADTWLESLLFHQLALSEGGEQSTIYDTFTGKTTFATDPVLMKAADMVKQLVDGKMFQQGYVTTDYGTARNYFGQGLAAMYYMGSWESGLAADEAFSEEFRSNLNVTTFPVGTNGKSGNVIAWNGGGYGVSANSANKEEALKFLAFMFQPDQLTKISWQVAGAIPAQKWEDYKTGKETLVQNQLTAIMSNAIALSGTDFQDSKTPEFKNNVCDAVSSLFAGVTTPAEALTALDQAVANLK